MTYTDFFNLNNRQKQRLKDIVLARTQVMPNDVNVFIGGIGLTRDDLIKHINQEDKIGKQLMALELNFLRDLASSTVYQNE